MYSQARRDEALTLVSEGLTLSQASRRSGVSRAAIREWIAHPERSAARASDCPICDGAPLNPEAYSALLGYYLGDGCISRMPRYYAVRVSCDAAYPGIIEDIDRCLEAVRPRGRIHHVRAPGTVVVQGAWQHWRCLFPQHGPGRKHERPIALDEWQRSIVALHPGPFLRGLFHSDGCRANNWAQRVVDGQKVRRYYPRWQFTNVSQDIRELCCWALDLAGIAWRQSNSKTISVSRRPDVARLDELIGLKT
jgi:hypothetical protein